LQLTAAHLGHPWVRGENVAKCLRDHETGVVMIMTTTAGVTIPVGEWESLTPPHEAPAPGCHCGLYALHAPTFWYGPDATRAQGGLLGRHPASGCYVAGLVAAWGRMEVHADGFRAERARVVAIAIPDRKRDAAVARAVAAEYGVPTVPQAELERVAGEFGASVPNHLRPERPDTYRDLYQTLASAFSGPRVQPIYLGSSPHVELFPSPTRRDTGADKQRGFREWSRAVSKMARAGAIIAPQTPQERIRELKRPTYDPQAFTAKRNGGRR
jgi:hypothetical protein